MTDLDEIKRALEERDAKLDEALELLRRASPPERVTRASAHHRMMRGYGARERGEEDDRAED